MYKDAIYKEQFIPFTMVIFASIVSVVLSYTSPSTFSLQNFKSKRRLYLFYAYFLPLTHLVIDFNFIMHFAAPDTKCFCHWQISTLTNNSYIVQRNSKQLPFQKNCFITPFFIVYVGIRLPSSLIVSSICFTPATHFFAACS